MNAERSAEAMARELEGSRYRWVRALAEGGQGEVHVVEHLDLGTTGVLKLIRGDLDGELSSELGMRLRTEARVLIRLSHENLVRVLDFGWTRSQRAFLVSELLEGETYADRIKREQTLPEALAANLGVQTLSGLRVVHEAGMVHRDVKPANLFLCGPVGGPHPTLKILDFGTAKMLSAAAKEVAGAGVVPTVEGTTIGTPYFIAPEQILGESIDARADIYALGCTLYRALVGEPPFMGKRHIDVFEAHIYKRPVPPSEAARQPISDRMNAIVMRALQKKPEDRFASAEEMSEALRALSRPVARPAAVVATERIEIAAPRVAPKQVATVLLANPSRVNADPVGPTFAKAKGAPGRIVIGTPEPDAPSPAPAQAASRPDLAHRLTQPLAPKPVAEASPAPAAIPETPHHRDDDGPTLIEPTRRAPRSDPFDLRIALAVAALIIVVLVVVLVVVLAGKGGPR